MPEVDWGVCSRGWLQHGPKYFHKHVSTCPSTFTSPSLSKYFRKDIIMETCRSTFTSRSLSKYFHKACFDLPKYFHKSFFVEVLSQRYHHGGLSKYFHKSFGLVHSKHFCFTPPLLHSLPELCRPPLSATQNLTDTTDSPGPEPRLFPGFSSPLGPSSCFDLSTYLYKSLFLEVLS